MTAAAYILVQCLVIFLDVLSLAMLGRAIVSWFVMGGESKIAAFLYVVTEPMILPLRALCYRFGWFQGMPIDMPFLLTMVCISLGGTFLQTALL